MDDIWKEPNPERIFGGIWKEPNPCSIGKWIEPVPSSFIWYDPKPNLGQWREPNPNKIGKWKE